MSPKLKLGSVLVFLLAVALTTANGQQPKSTSKHRRGPKHTAASSVDTALAAAAKSFVATGCDDSLWGHVYHPQRLQVVEKCITVTGTIHHIKKEADGDDHIQLKLDPKYAGLLNSWNTTVQAASLVVEPICQNLVTQADAQDACRDFHSGVNIPPQGGHVQVLGSYVLDSEANHGWMEIHPVTKIEVIP